MREKAALGYWGKAGKDCDGYHLLPYHCLDVAACGVVLLERHPPLRRLLAGRLGLVDARLSAWLAFFLALHDLGKFSPRFQALRPDLFQHLQPGRSVGPGHVRHDTLGWRLWTHLLAEPFIATFGGQSAQGGQCRTLRAVFGIWMRCVTGHHGQPPKDAEDGFYLADQFPPEDQEAAAAYVDACRALFLGEEISLPNPKAWEKTLKPFSWWIAGVAVLCDWLGSNVDRFKMRSTPMPLAVYWRDYALPQAAQAVAGSGLIPLTIPTCDLDTLFGYLKPPTPLQRLAADLPLPGGPQLLILEEVTGAGKTEAALMLAQRLMGGGGGDGLFLALPTMATSNAMYRRVVERRLAGRLFGGEPGLVLAHSAARLMDPPAPRAEPLGAGPGEADYQPGEAAAAGLRVAWIGDSRKKALLADFGIGTLDQALLAILPVRHQSLRLLGLIRKVLIVDEVHACDAYMLELLEALLRFQASVGASVLLLSATLPRANRRRLADAFRAGLALSPLGSGLSRPAASPAGSEPADGCTEAYPLLTRIDGAGIDEHPIGTRPEMVRRVRVARIDNRAEIHAHLLAAHRQGQCACWVRNSVADTIEAWEALAEVGIPKDRLHLFHARFALGDRLAIESAVLGRFGPESGPAERGGHILVATQVVEQSLDLDFDSIVSDLAPIDLLIQRAGRLRRHKRDASGQRVENEGRGEPLLWLFAPAAVEDAGPRWLEELLPRTARVYPELDRLWLTLRRLDERGGIAMPEDARRLIEGVYGPESEGLPPGLIRVRTEQEGKRQATRSVARFNALELAGGYAAKNDYWDDIYTPTRLGDPSVRLRLARWEDGKLIPWSADPHHPWPMSEVSVREAWFQGEAAAVDSALKAAMTAYRAEVFDQGRWSWLLVLQPAAGGGWEGAVIDDQERQRGWLRYDRERGLMRG
jgi:CRISPR-associated endonuclease/helicase Cas3